MAAIHGFYEIGNFGQIASIINAAIVDPSKNGIQIASCLSAATNSVDGLLRQFSQCSPRFATGRKCNSAKEVSRANFLGKMIYQ